MIKIAKLYLLVGNDSFKLTICKFWFHMVTAESLKSDTLLEIWVYVTVVPINFHTTNGLIVALAFFDLLLKVLKLKKLLLLTALAP